MRGERFSRSLEMSWQRGDDAIDVGDGEQLRAGLVEPPLVRRREARYQGRHRFEIGSGKDVPWKRLLRRRRAGRVPRARFGTRCSRRERCRSGQGPNRR